MTIKKKKTIRCFLIKNLVLSLMSLGFILESLKSWWLGDEVKNDPIDIDYDGIDMVHISDSQNDADNDFQRIYNHSDSENPDLEPYYKSRKHEIRQGMWKKIKDKAPYYIPIIMWLPRYNIKSNLINDIVAGIGVGAMIIPQCLAYATLAGVPPENGLYTAFFPIIIYFFMGTSQQLSIGPDALSSLLIGIILPKIDVKSTRLFPLLAFTVGCILLMLGIARFGFVENILSKPLLCGFVNAVAVTIIIEQTDIIFGLPSRNKHGWRKLVSWYQDISEINWVTFGLGLIFISILLGIRFLKKQYNVFKYIPETFVVIIIGIVVMYTSTLSSQGVVTLGSMNSGFEKPSVPKLGYYDSKEGIAILTNAVLISVIGFIEHIVTAKLYSKNKSISPNREMVAVGCANIFGSFFCTYPTFGSLPRSAVADLLGAKSQASNLIVILLVGAVILFMSPVLYYLPKVSMGSTVIVASFGLFEFEDLEFLIRIRAWKELALSTLTFILMIVLGIELGIFISLAISTLFIIRTISYPTVTILGYQPETKLYTEISVVNSKVLPGLVIVRVEQDLFFANINQFKSVFMKIEKLGDPKAHPSRVKNKEIAQTKAIIIQAKNIFKIDASAIIVLQQMMHDYQKRDILVVFVKLRENLIEPLIRAKILNESSSENKVLFYTLDQAVSYCQEKLNLEPPPFFNDQETFEEFDFQREPKD